MSDIMLAGLIAILFGLFMMVDSINRRTYKMALKQSELAAKFDAQTALVQKIADEIQVLVNALKNAEIPADAQASLDRLDAALKSADDLNPDQAPPPPPPGV
jgi:hypothetical protein